MPPRPNSVPNQATGLMLTNSPQLNPERSTYELKPTQIFNVRNNAEGYSSPRKHELSVHDSNLNSVSGVRNTANLKTHGEIYQQFAEQNELINMENVHEDEVRNNSNNDNNNLHTDQDLHFAKRLTWNISTEDKMQTSTDAIETPTADQNNLNSNQNSPPSSLHIQNSRQYPNFPGKYHEKIFNKYNRFIYKMSKGAKQKFDFILYYFSSY